MWDGSSSPTGTGGVGLAAGVSIDSTNKVLKLENIGAGPDYAYFSLGTLAVKAYKFKLYYKLGRGTSMQINAWSSSSSTLTVIEVAA